MYSIVHVPTCIILLANYITTGQSIVVVCAYLLNTQSFVVFAILLLLFTFSGLYTSSKYNIVLINAIMYTNIIIKIENLMKF